MTQKETIRKHLEKKGTIDTWTCFQKYGITRLSQYIMELRREGNLIINEWIKPKKGNQYVKYILTQKKTCCNEQQIN